MHFFSDIDAYVLAAPGKGNDLQIAASETNAGPAVSCFLSPLHAMLDVMYWAGKGKSYEVRHAGSISPQTFVNAKGTALVAQLRVGWPALDGKIVLESNGNTATCAKLMVHSMQKKPPPIFELDPETLGQVERMHESAGMYAWREVYAGMLEWDKGRLEWALKRAVETMKISTVDKSMCTKAALFDPEFGQWHFVPFANL